MVSLKKLFCVFFNIVFIGIFIIFILNIPNKLLSLLLIVLFTIFSLLIQKSKIDKKTSCILLFCFAIFIRLLTLLFLKIEPYSDFAILLDASSKLANGTNILNESSYFLCWAYQTGFVLYQSFILKIFNSVLALHILDCIFTASICLLIYIIGNIINEKNNKLPSILYCLYVYAITYTGVLTNQHIFTFLTLIAILILLKGSKFDKRKNIIVGIILGIANILRPESIVFLLSIVVYYIFSIESKKDLKNVFISILLIFISYIAITQIASFTIRVTNINKNGLNNNDPLWKFVCGSDYESAGSYSEKGLSVMGDKSLEKSFIIQNYQNLNLKSLVKFFIIKINAFWALDAYYWVFPSTQGLESIVNNCIAYDSSIYCFIILAVIFSSLVELKNNHNNGKFLLFAILLVNFVVYLFIEVQPRYSYTSKIIMFILAGDGIFHMLNFYKKLIAKLKRKDVIKND